MSLVTFSRKIPIIKGFRKVIGKSINEYNGLEIANF